jgi:hypothetical protein
MEKITFSFAALGRDHRDDDSTSLRRHCKHGRQAMREANADSLRRKQCHNVHHGHDSDGDIGAYLRHTLDGSTPTDGSSGNGTQIEAARGTVEVTFGVGPNGTTLKAIAYKAGLADSPVAVGNYVYQSPY